MLEIKGCKYCDIKYNCMNIYMCIFFKHCLSSLQVHIIWVVAYYMGQFVWCPFKYFLLFPRIDWKIVTKFLTCKERWLADLIEKPALENFNRTVSSPKFIFVELFSQDVFLFGTFVCVK